jgi:hypothetical protein
MHKIKAGQHMNSEAELLPTDSALSAVWYCCTRRAHLTHMHEHKLKNDLAVVNQHRVCQPALTPIKHCNRLAHTTYHDSPSIADQMQASSADTIQPN